MRKVKPLAAPVFALGLHIISSEQAMKLLLWLVPITGRQYLFGLPT
jgi:hypothetical protein